MTRRMLLEVAALSCLVACGGLAGPMPETSSELPAPADAEKPPPVDSGLEPPPAPVDAGGPDAGPPVEDAGAPSPVDGGLQTLSFARDEAVLPNPERGFSPNLVSYSQDPRPLDDARLLALKATPMRLVQRVFVMTQFKSSPLSPSYLASLQGDFDKLRQHGFKAVLRFCYTHNESTASAAYDGYQDAPLSVILGHIAQLGPLLTKNADVIAYVNVGFIGRWGEWNKSTHGLGDETNPQNVGAQRSIVEALLAATPARRMLSLRYLSRKQALYGPNPLTRTQAYSGKGAARIGGTNDYFTIDYPGSAERAYFNQDNLYVPYGGEPIRWNGTRSECAAVEDELRQFHWSHMNEPGGQFATTWQAQGCLERIQKNLGYRFLLESVALPREVASAGLLQVSLRMKNEGYASPYNPRALQLVLRRGETVHRLPIPLAEDARLVLPAPGTTRELGLSVRLPALPPGAYELSLALPDPEVTLANRPEYAIRLANVGVWDGSRGLNRLGNLAVR